LISQKTPAALKPWAANIEPAIERNFIFIKRALSLFFVAAQSPTTIRVVNYQFDSRAADELHAFLD
jgi:hypothetical protein